MADQAGQDAAGKQARKGGGRGILTAILMLPVLAVLFPSCIVLMTGMAPSIVAYFVDRTTGKYLTITVALMNFCGTLPGLGDLWLEGQSIARAMTIAVDPFHWLAAYASAGAGWSIFLLVPPILKVHYARTAVTRIEALRQKQAALVEVWGDEVGGGSQGGAKDS